MFIFKTLFNVAKGAALKVVSDVKTQIIPPTLAQSQSEKKVHEIVTLVTRIVVSVLDLIKLLRAFVPNFLWKSPNQ